MTQLILIPDLTPPACELPPPAPRDPFLSSISFDQLRDFRALALRDFADARLTDDAASQAAALRDYRAADREYWHRLNTADVEATKGFTVWEVA